MIDLISFGHKLPLSLNVPVEDNGGLFVEKTFIWQNI